ncbi:hypothetical protein GCM10009854_36790 [Saccharopolyspora halophila]|uniref:Uncharacterized protein n=1 Tax=Saccharopolyspora halophila TaxID=405551 RepID=A0ABN3GM33_9PSEU
MIGRWRGRGACVTARAVRMAAQRLDLVTKRVHRYIENAGRCAEMCSIRATGFNTKSAASNPLSGVNAPLKNRQAVYNMVSITLELLLLGVLAVKVC